MTMRERLLPGRTTLPNNERCDEGCLGTIVILLRMRAHLQSAVRAPSGSRPSLYHQLAS